MPPNRAVKPIEAAVKPINMLWYSFLMVSIVAALVFTFAFFPVAATLNFNLGCLRPYGRNFPRNNLFIIRQPLAIKVE